MPDTIPRGGGEARSAGTATDETRRVRPGCAVRKPDDGGSIAAPARTEGCSGAAWPQDGDRIGGMVWAIEVCR